MKHIDTFKNHSDITFEVKKHKVSSKSKEKIDCNYVSLKKDGKTVSKCIFFIPTPNKLNYDDEYRIDDGGSIEIFRNCQIAKVYLFESKVKGQGYGTLLLKKLITYLKNINIKQIHLDVDADNIKAQKFYKNFGFKKKWKGFDNYRYYIDIK